MVEMIVGVGARCVLAFVRPARLHGRSAKADTQPQPPTVEAGRHRDSRSHDAYTPTLARSNARIA